MATKKAVEVKAEAPKAEVKVAAPVAEKKVEAPKAAPAKKAPAAKKAAPAKKVAAKKPAAKKAIKIAEPKVVEIQAANGQGVSYSDVVKKVNKKLAKELSENVKTLAIYVKPEDGKAYIVANGNDCGSVDLF